MRNRGRFTSDGKGWTHRLGRSATGVPPGVEYPCRRAVKGGKVDGPATKRLVEDVVQPFAWQRGASVEMLEAP